DAGTRSATLKTRLDRQLLCCVGTRQFHLLDNRSFPVLLSHVKAPYIIASTSILNHVNRGMSCFVA
ncbi:MAG: hypothetical protein KAI09_02630, partial [Dehalococcoidales bacterium]|nr:hypothetical protein [Dehalococcoidales bacterium]